MKTFLAIVYTLIFYVPTSFSQIQGQGLIDGVYRFDISLGESIDGLMEGNITYDDLEKEPRILVGMTYGDTLRCSEIDDYLNPTAEFLLINRGNYFDGYWYDKIYKSQLPLLFFVDEEEMTVDLNCIRYETSQSNLDEKKLFEIPLSPTIKIGKYELPGLNKVVDFASNRQYEHVYYYTESGILEFNESRIIEEIPVVPYRFIHGHTTAEALIPDFGRRFVDSLQTTLVKWADELALGPQANRGSRFGVRNYAICDIDFWSSQYIAGSFEYITQESAVAGFTFLFDRRDEQFIGIPELIRSGSIESIENSTRDDKYIGLSFDRYGLLKKGFFNSSNSRFTEHISWAEANIRMKRKLDDIKK